jgi:hypothetical protein
MKPKEVITNEDRIKRLVKSLKPFRHDDAVLETYIYDGNVYVVLPGILLIYDYLEYRADSPDFHRNGGH